MQLVMLLLLLTLTQFVPVDQEDMLVGASPWHCKIPRTVGTVRAVFAISHLRVLCMVVSMCLGHSGGYTQGYTYVAAVLVAILVGSHGFGLVWRWWDDGKGAFGS